VSSARAAVPLGERRIDLVFIAFFLINLGFITYIVDVEQIIIDDPAKFAYPAWPPAKLVDLIHWWGRAYDPVLLARPTWWKATIWIDALFFGPFYAAAIYAWVKGREWIRLPAIIWASVMMTNVVIILSEEIWGPHATPRLGMVLFANAPWLLVPIGVIARMARERPFSRPLPRR
jgi:emopamil binding protein